MAVAIRPAASALDFEYVRRLRNANRRFLTGDARRIGVLRQLRFWLSRPASIDLHVAELDGRRCGYLLLRRDGDTTWITEVVDARHRGRGVAALLAGARDRPRARRARDHHRPRRNRRAERVGRRAARMARLPRPRRREPAAHRVRMR